MCRILLRLVSFTVLICVLSLLLGSSHALAQEEPEPFIRSFSAEQKGVVTAGEILKAIGEGRRIEIVHAVIVGQIAFRYEIDPYSWEPTVIKNAIRFEDCQFQDAVYFSDVYFVQEASFIISQFNQGAYFSGARFYQNVYFNQVQFDQSADFSWAVFDQDTNFYKAQFNQVANFSRAYFNQDAYFRDAQFNQDAIFSEAWINQDADFRNAQFNQDAIFSEAWINQDAKFRGAQFQGVVDFTLIDFSEMQIGWSPLEGKLVYDNWFYVSLIRNFDNLGQFDDADSAYLSYRVAKRDVTYSDFDPRRFLEFIFLDFTCGYGVRPFRAIRAALIIILGCAAIYYRTGAIRQLRPDENRKSRSRRRRIVDSLYFSVNTFTTVGYGDWYPTEQPLIKIWKIRLGSVRTLAMIEGLMGWFVLALFLVTLGKVWIR